MARAPRPPFVRPGGPVGRGVALPPTVPLPSLGRQQSGCHWRRSGHGGRGPHTAPGHARLLSLGAVRAASWRVGAGSLAPCSHCGSRWLGRGGVPCSGLSHGRRGPARGEGASSPLPRGVGAGAPAACRPAGGTQGGVAPRLPCSPSGGRPAVSYPAPPLVVGAFPPGVRVRSGSRGRPVHPVRPAWWGWGGEGAARGPLPRGPLLTGTLPLPSPSGQHCGCHWRCSGHRGRGPHTVLVRRRVPAPGVVRAPLRRAGAGSPIGRHPRGSRRLGALGRAVCRSSWAPPPLRRGPFWGRGGVPSAPGGWRVGAPAALKPGGEGGALRRPPPPRPVGRWPATLCLRRAPPGYTRAVGVAGQPWVSGAAQSAANWSVRRAGGREGGSDLLALVHAPAFPTPASEGAAPFAPSWAPPVRRRSVAGRAGAGGRFTGGACRGRGAPAPRAQRPPRGGAGPLSLRSACVGPWA